MRSGKKKGKRTKKREKEVIPYQGGGQTGRGEAAVMLMVKATILTSALAGSLDIHSEVDSGPSFSKVPRLQATGAL